MAASSEDDTIIVEEREELMVSPTGSGDPILRIAHFLKPSISVPLSDLPSPPSPNPYPPTIFSDPKKRQFKVEFRGWICPQNDWKSWVHRMHSLHQLTWMNSGIHDAVLNSTYKIERNDAMVFGFAGKWCSDTNSFVFPWGEATVTLEDMMVLGGYSVSGDSVSIPLKNRDFEEIHEKLHQVRLQLVRTSSHKASVYQWKNHFMNSGSEIEHEAFIAYWLSRYGLPTSPHDTITKEYFPIAIHLARGTKIALAPAVLACIYRDLSLLKQSIVDSIKIKNTEFEQKSREIVIWAPLQLVQIWVWERFPSLGPKPNSPINPSAPRMARWNRLKNRKIENLNSILDSASEEFQWRPYAISVSKPFKFYQEHEQWVTVDSDLDEEIESFSRFLRVSELVGFDCVEQYLPHRVALQFGIDQDIPHCVKRTNQNSKTGWKNYTRPIGDSKLYVPPRLFEPSVTLQYLEWWKRSNFDDSKNMGSKKLILLISDEDEGSEEDEDHCDDDDSDDDLTVAEACRKRRRQNCEKSSSSIADNEDVENMKSTKEPVREIFDGQSSSERLEENVMEDETNLLDEEDVTVSRLENRIRKVENTSEGKSNRNGVNSVNFPPGFERRESTREGKGNGNKERNDIGFADFPLGFERNENASEEKSNEKGNGKRKGNDLEIFDFPPGFESKHSKLKAKSSRNEEGNQNIGVINANDIENRGFGTIKGLEKPVSEIEGRTIEIPWLELEERISKAEKMMNQLESAKFSNSFFSLNLPK